VNPARVLIVGGGVAGCECAWGLARAGVETLLLSTSLDTLYALPADRWSAAVPAGTLWRLSPAGALARHASGMVRGVRTWEGPLLRAATVVLAVGGFLGARLRYGDAVERAGRLGEMAYDDLRDDLVAAGVAFVRREHAIPARGEEPGYDVAYDALTGHATFGFPGIADRAGALWVGACAAEVGLEAAAIAGRELARQLVAQGPPPEGAALSRAP
jgi:tRNA U34 5-carboxymethylaminomethyl modifying enzyme MnmG/GidA